MTQDVFAIKQQFLEAFYSSLKTRYEEIMNENNESDDDGWFSSVKKQVISNIQISVKNIHIRVEVLNPKMHSFGFTLSELEIYTTNADYYKQFVDPTSEKNKDKPIYKKLDLKELTVYWNCQDTEYCKMSYSKEVVIDRMKNTIYRNSTDHHTNNRQVDEEQNNQGNFNYLIHIALEMKLIYYPEKNKEMIEKGIPQFKFNFDINRGEVTLTSRQFAQIIN